MGAGGGGGGSGRRGRESLGQDGYTTNEEKIQTTVREEGEGAGEGNT